MNQSSEMLEESSIVVRFAQESPQWIATHVILRAMYYKKWIQIRGLETYINFDSHLASQLYLLYEQHIKSDFDARNHFIDAVHIALEEWDGKSPKDVQYLIELFHLLGFLRQTRFVNTFQIMMDEGQVIDRLSDEEYMLVADEGMIIVTDFVNNINTSTYRFVHQTFFNKQNEAKYAYFAPRSFIALCRVEPDKYPIYLNRFLELISLYPHHYPYLNEDIKAFGDVVDARTFAEELPHIDYEKLKPLLERPKLVAGFKYILNQYLAIDAFSQNANILAFKKFINNSKFEFSDIYVGQVIPNANVVRVEKFGAYVDIGGLTGLVRNNEISWKAIQHPDEALTPHQKVTVEVISKDEHRIELSIKRQQPDPWDNIATYRVGDLVNVVVVRVTRYYVFVRLTDYEEIEGKISSQEFSSTRVINIRKSAPEGKKLILKIKEINIKEHILILSLKDARPQPERISIPQSEW